MAEMCLSTSTFPIVEYQDHEENTLKPPKSKCFIPTRVQAENEKNPPLLFRRGLTQESIWRHFFGCRVSSSLTTQAF